MRKGWEYKKLGEVCALTMGQSPDGNSINEVNGIEFHQGKTCFGERFLGISPLYSNAPTKLAEAHSVLLCVRAPVGYPNITDRKICIGRGLCALYAKREIDNSFLYYSLLGKQSYFEKNATGSTFKAISSKIVSNTTLSIPPLSTQLAIVSELDKINELIRLKKEQLKDFDNLAQSLFYEMFGEGKCLRKKLKDIVKIQSGQVSPLEEPYSEMIHVGPANIESNTGRLLNLKTAKEENLISGKYLFNSSMVLYSKIRPNLNKVTIPSFEGICSADMYPIIPLECIDKNFLLFLLKQKEFLTYAISNSGRANIPKINREALLNYEAILPSLSLQRLFAQRIEQIEREKSEVQKSIQDLETLLASRMQYWFE